jgi:signal transduction histidine kinase
MSPEGQSIYRVTNQGGRLARWRRFSWIAFTATVGLLYGFVASVAPARRYGTAVFGDISQSLLLAALVYFVVRNVVSSSGLIRRFWMFVSLWAIGWLGGTLIWSWFEIVLRRPVPDVFLGDMLFFLLPVALMAALAVLPHVMQPEGRLAFSWLDSLLLLLFWAYLYVVAVIPWEYVRLNTSQYSRNYDLLHAVETALPVFALVPLYLGARGRWRSLYGMLFWGAATFAVAVLVINRALAVHAYYSGSAFDLGIVISTCIFIAAAVVGAGMPKPDSEMNTRLVGVIASRLAMAAVFSLPFFGLWAYWAPMPETVRHFRLAATAAALIVMQALVSVKVGLLDRDLARLWRQAHTSYHYLRRSHKQLIQTERLAALVQFIAVADDEICNPLTSILGYSALLVEDPTLAPDTHTHLRVIIEQARRVSDAMHRLRKLAIQPLGLRERLQVNRLLEEAVELRSLDIAESAEVKITRSLAGGLPSVIGDSAQLLQVCFCIIGNAIEDLRLIGGGTVSVSSRLVTGRVVVEIAEDGEGLSQVGGKLMGVFDRNRGSTPSASSLAISACYSILQEHRGRLSCRSLDGGGSAVTLELPTAEEPADSLAVTPRDQFSHH